MESRKFFIPHLYLASPLEFHQDLGHQKPDSVASIVRRYLRDMFGVSARTPLVTDRHRGTDTYRTIAYTALSLRRQ